ncbi:MAG TPA: tRNA preQ1(34) S-adenosylmethionine ribosyltransferase-isomerase QueA [Desulfobacterales bacterium]|nr:tRNA preQ1(34) S-adenosylmethionine ribosyltransferase-isomerase QueA [Desulfobacterales bacterium]
MHSLDDYDYELPPERIAQAPAERRDRSRLMRLDRASGVLDHLRFDALAERLAPGDALVVNDTAVVPARLLGRKDSGGRVEVFLVDYAGGTRTPDGGFACECLIKASKPTRAGARIRFDAGLTGTVVQVGDGSCRVEFGADGDFDAALDRVGHVPLPPYIRRPDGEADRATYQTVYAAARGAVAAPTAGLHFTPGLLSRLQARGVRLLPLTLHVGYGTFAPVRVADIREHRMHAERFAIPEATAAGIAAARAAGGRVVAVGTTVVRTLEHAADGPGRIRPGAGSCELFIRPGYRFKVVDALVTNFHLPRSTLLMLVSAFAGRERVLAAYREAVAAGYRFFSYGDAMLIE